MPADTLHPSYSLAVEDWQMIEDCLAGQTAIKAAGPKYLPMLADQEASYYAHYKARAVFWNAVSRTREAMLGFLFRKPPVLEFPKTKQATRAKDTDAPMITETGTGDLDTLAADADLAEAPLQAYARRVAGAVCSTGRAGTLIDWSMGENRPYFTFYDARNIINWRTERINGKTVLGMVVLKEAGGSANPADEFETKQFFQYRVLDLVGFPLNADEPSGAKVYQCRVRIFRASADSHAAGAPRTIPGTGSERQGGPVQVGGDEFIVRRGKALAFIPFVFHNAENTGVEIGQAPLADIAYVNISQYQSSADLEWGRHKCGLPTPWASGFGTDAMAKLITGTEYAWTSDEKGATCGYLEFTGQGLSSLTTAITEKAEQMASLGARLIEPKGGNAEAYETVALKASAETSTLAKICMLLSESLSVACRIAEWWIGTGDELNAETKISINSDFTSAAATGEWLGALGTAYQQSIISRETLHYQLERGEMFAPGRTMEEERESIDNNPPMPPPAPPGFRKNEDDEPAPPPKEKP